MLSALFAMALGLVAAATPTSAQQRFPTAENAVYAYIYGVSQLDFDAVIAVTAVDEMAEGLDFLGFVGWLGAMTSQLPAPSNHPFLVEVNRAVFKAGIAKQLQMLVYGLMTTSEIVDNKVVVIDEAGVAAFEAQIDASRLSGIELIKVGIPNPTLLNSESNLFNMARNAKSLGADEATERIALITFEGDHYMLGFSLLRYGDNWKIRFQVSGLGGGNPMGAPTKVTPQEFDALLE
jgi:hypothetical protein